nr:hypothetical protein [Tanacetum cinerariifolium]
MPTTLGEVFSLARIAESRVEDERSTIAIVKPNELTENEHVHDLEQTTRGRGDEPNRIQLVTIHHMIPYYCGSFESNLLSSWDVVDSGNGSALIFLVGYGTGSEVVTGLPDEFQEGDMVDALSRVLEQKRSEKGG